MTKDNNEPKTPETDEGEYIPKDLSEAEEMFQQYLMGDKVIKSRFDVDPDDFRVTGLTLEEALEVTRQSREERAQFAEKMREEYRKKKNEQKSQQNGDE